MATISEIFSTYGNEYIERYKDAIPAGHVKVINAIINCRTEAYGAVFYKCEGCGEIHTSYRSCGNRHCPRCQNHKTKMWIYKQLKNALPCYYFMITFTLPQEIRDVVRKNQKACYSALFSSSSGALKKLTPDKKYMGGDTPGFFGVLHTWGRQLQYHPHIHYVVPGGSISKDDGSWHKSRDDYYLPEKSLSIIFKAKFMDTMKALNLYQYIPKEAWDKDWVVNCEQVGNGRNCLKYLSRYVFKVAISNSRIKRVENRRVYMTWKKVGSSRQRPFNLDVMEFIRRFLLHVLPSGFMKIRYYGFLHPSCSVDIEKLKQTIRDLQNIQKENNEETEEIQQPSLECVHCKKSLKFIFAILPSNIRIIASGFT